MVRVDDSIINRLDISENINDMISLQKSLATTNLDKQTVTIEELIDINVKDLGCDGKDHGHGERGISKFAQNQAD